MGGWVGVSGGWGCGVCGGVAVRYRCEGGSAGWETVGRRALWAGWVRWGGAVGAVVVVCDRCRGLGALRAHISN